MSNVKMPEPAGTICFDGGVLEEDWVSSQLAYSEDQMKQYGDDRAREALEMAAVAAWSFHMDRSKRAGLSPTAYEAWSPVSTIRALTKEIK